VNNPFPAEPLVLANYLERSRERILSTLLDWVRIPSISAHPEHAADLASSAQFCRHLLQEAGLHRVEVLATGTPEVPGGPTVYGEWLDAGPGAPTVLVYCHHDVQPADPLEQWASPPFEPVVRDGTGDGFVLARGASDDKGPAVMQVEAVRGLLAERGSLPVNLKFLVEGEEEIGSPHLEPLLVQRKEQLAADVVIVSDTTMLAPDLPSATMSMRGLIAFDIALRTAQADLHSGLWGGTVPNAALLASRLAADLHDADRRVTLPGFYDRVLEMTDEESRSLAQIPFDEEVYKHQAGVAYLEGEAGRNPLERTGTRPTAEVVGIHSGYGGPGMKTIVPAEANLKIALRLVPNQDPDQIEESLHTWLAERVPVGATYQATRYGGVKPLVTPLDHSAVGALTVAIERVWGKAPLFTREGGSGPEEALGRILGAPVIALGVSLPTDNFHAPNERFDLGQLWRGILAAGELLVELGKANG
jgi:acetylornithine deacetylase/succinyl-diaminopimelate desuccinylase-like protein